MVTVTVASMIPADPGSGLDSQRDSLWVEGNLVLSGDYGGADTHGDTLDLTGFAASDYSPKNVWIYQEPTAGVAPVIYCFLYGRGTTPANGVLIVTDFAGAEITEGDPYPAALTNTDVPPNIRFIARFAKNV